jgi:hypothetical protein
MNQGSIHEKNRRRKMLCYCPFKGIVQRILRGVNTKLKLSVPVNWRPASFLILKGHHIKRSIKPFSAALLIKMTFWHFSICVR